MLPVNYLFEYVDEIENVGKLAKAVGKNHDAGNVGNQIAKPSKPGFFSKLFGMGPKKTDDVGVKKRELAALKKRDEISEKRGFKQGTSEYDKRLKTDRHFGRQKVAQVAGQELAHGVKGAANFVGKHQLGTGAAAIGAGAYLAGKKRRN